jgi:hypothetical protein
VEVIKRKVRKGKKARNALSERKYKTALKGLLQNSTEQHRNCKTGQTCVL